MNGDYKADIEVPKSILTITKTLYKSNYILYTRTLQTSSKYINWNKQSDKKQGDINHQTNI